MRSSLFLGLALAAFGSAIAAPPDCSSWTLDGYRLGMPGDELLAVRSVTMHVENQAQANEPGRFQGVLVLDVLNRLQKWDVRYDAAEGDELRADLEARIGEPASDVSGYRSGDETDTARQRRTIWWSTACDAAIIVYDNDSARGAPGRRVSATLARTSAFPPGLVQMKSLVD